MNKAIIFGPSYPQGEGVFFIVAWGVEFRLMYVRLKYVSRREPIVGLEIPAEWRGARHPQLSLI